MMFYFISNEKGGGGKKGKRGGKGKGKVVVEA